MKRNKYVVLIFLVLFSAICLLVVIELTQRKQKIETIQYTETVTTGDLTLLERMYVDVDSDNKDESIELYTSAKRGKDGRMEWDDGQRWLLLVRAEGKRFLLFDGYVQLGQIEFWVVIFNKSQIIRPNNVDLEKHIFVMKTGNSIQLSKYYWDKQNLCFKKETVFDPPNQWDVKSSYKYSYNNPTLIEPVKYTPDN